MNNNVKKKKIYFFIVLAIYIVSRTIYNIKFNYQNILNGININNNNHISGNIIILTSTIISFCILLIILILARFISIVYCKIAYKDQSYKQKLDDIYYMATSFKLTWLIIGNLLDAFSINNTAILINIAAIISYMIWIFVIKYKSGNELLVKITLGVFLIVFV